MPHVKGDSVNSSVDSLNKDPMNNSQAEREGGTSRPREGLWEKNETWDICQCDTGRDRRTGLREGGKEWAMWQEVGWDYSG